MEKLEHHREVVKQVLTEYSKRKPAYGEIEVYTSFDEQGEHYQVISAGWHNQRRIYGCSIHIDLKNDKIWIQYDRTEIGIANVLLEHEKKTGARSRPVSLAMQNSIALIWGAGGIEP